MYKLTIKPNFVQQVIKETINALKSVMSINDVMTFSALPEKEKLESLIGIREIVCGIRVFNKDSGQCGEGMVDCKYKFKILMA